MTTEIQSPKDRVQSIEWSRGENGMKSNRAVLDRMIADRAARDRRTAFWANRTADMRARALRQAAANDTHAPARTGS